jgi:hypothetical protein
MNKTNIISDGITLPYFCKDCAFLLMGKEEDRKCGDLCCHPTNDKLTPSKEAMNYKFRQLINWNESQIGRKIE